MEAKKRSKIKKMRRRKNQKRTTFFLNCFLTRLGEMALFELILSKIDNGTATDEDLEFYVVMKAKHGLK